ncbi:uncharacterized protein LOC135215828 [Macrobrachium nipponense]|uniref:uncharacterized protein LOC135215828 n=1 Tax=Macrobrachium nipponense TaxID=159736 RepID=UPI0030C8AF39
MGTSLHATTAYNPAANGMVERVHRSLKASLMARCTGEDWKSQLSWVLLGFGPPLGRTLKHHLRRRTKRFLLKALSSCKHVFIRDDACRPPLTRPYRGPFRVIRRTDKAYFISINGCEDWVTIDRLKPAFLMDEEYANADPIGRLTLLRKEATPLIAKPPSRSCGRPRKTVEPPEGHLRGGIPSPKIPEDSEAEDLPQQLVSRTRGRLRRPARFCE